MFNWLRPAPVIDADLWNTVLSSHAFLNTLLPVEQKRLKVLAEQLLKEKSFDGVHGLVIDDHMASDIAAQACLPVLSLGLDWYRGWEGVIVYPSEFVIPRVEMDEAGVVHQYSDIASGEAWEGGPVLLSWLDTRQHQNGYNVVIHEFAHKIDMRNGPADGFPPLHSDMSIDDWARDMSAGFDAFSAHLDQQGERYCGWLDPYAAESPAEFFAVLSEAFFVSPGPLLEEMPEIYAHLQRFYRQNTAKRAQFS